MHDSMRMDVDTTRDLDADMFILIETNSNLCHSVCVNGWACPLFSSLLVPFLAISSCWCQA